jgi:hypothetical protein
VAEHQDEHRPCADVAKNVGELNQWRKLKVDPMLDKHQAVLIDGEGGQPSVQLSQGLLHGKFDTLIDIGKIIIALITVFGSLITIFELGGPWVRQKLGLPVAVAPLVPGKPGAQPNQGAAEDGAIPRAVEPKTP